MASASRANRPVGLIGFKRLMDENGCKDLARMDLSTRG